MRHLHRLGHSVAAGALAGAALAPLQFLLWAEQSIHSANAILGLLAWASWGAVWLGPLLFGLVELLGLAPAWWADRRGFSIGLWRGLAVTVAVFLAAVAFWNQRTTRDLLVPANREALAVVAWLAVAYAAILLTIAVRRPKWRYPLLSALLGAVAFLVPVWAVWLATPPQEPPSVASEVPRFTPARNVLVVSWEGADLAWLLPVMEKGDMPFLHSRLERASWGQLRTVRPYTRSASLATLMTGCAPAVHGVVGRRAYRIPWLLQEPVTLLLDGPWPDPHQLPWRAWERSAGPVPRRATITQILGGVGLATGLAGWPGTWRATWELPPPLSAESPAFDALDSDLRAAIAAGLAAVPGSAEMARRAFAIAVEQHSRVVRRLGEQPVQALAVDSTLLSRLRPAFTPQGPEDPGEEVLRQAARLLDSQLRNVWLALGGEDTLLVVVSPYGLAPPSPWRRLAGVLGLSDRWRVSPAESPDGFVLLCGPGVRPATRLRLRRLADVVPTVLYLLELPVARDMAGGVILEAVTDEHSARVPLRRVASYPAPGR